MDEYKYVILPRALAKNNKVNILIIYIFKCQQED
jgi:hypothetical protein